VGIRSIEGLVSATTRFGSKLLLLLLVCAFDLPLSQARKQLETTPRGSDKGTAPSTLPAGVSRLTFNSSMGGEVPRETDGHVIQQHTPRSHQHTPRSRERESTRSQISSPRSMLGEHARYLRNGVYTVVHQSCTHKRAYAVGIKTRLISSRLVYVGVVGRRVGARQRVCV
jgi:hypothetical protein